MKDQFTLPRRNGVGTSQKLFKRTVENIEDLIRTGEYTSGMKLPAEKELGETFGVSRTVLREALRAVEAKGLISICAGKGIYVSTPNLDNLITPMELLMSLGDVGIDNLLQARHFLEPGIAHVAALRATAEDIEKLESCLRNMVSDLDNGDSFILADQQFHMSLALATNNPVLYVMARSVVESLAILRKTVYEEVGAPSKAVRRHQQILDAVKARNAPEAYQAMEAHILDVEEYQHIRLMEESLSNLDFSHGNP